MLELDQSYEISGFFKGWVQNKIRNDEHWPLCHFFWCTWALGVPRPHLGTNTGGCQCLNGHHSTYLEYYLLIRHLQSILNIFFPVSRSLSLVFFCKRNSKEEKAMEILIHSFHKWFWGSSMCQVLSGPEDLTKYKTCSLFSRTLNVLTSK